jgi:hypothetical protein
MNDANEAMKAAKETNRVIQVGSQRRSGANYHAAREYIQSGKFGKIVAVEMTWNVNQPDRWRRPALVAEIKESDTAPTETLFDESSLNRGIHANTSNTGCIGLIPPEYPANGCRTRSTRFTGFPACNTHIRQRQTAAFICGMTDEEIAIRRRQFSITDLLIIPMKGSK